MEHDHNISTCVTCKSMNDYAQEQYVEYEKKIASLVNAGQKLVAKGYPVLDGTDALKEWREVSSTEKGSS